MTSSMMNGMVFRRQRNYLRPVNSKKNIVQSITIVAAAATNTVTIAESVESPALADANGVAVGSTINTIYIEAWLYGNAVAGVNSSITWALGKNPGGNITLPTPSTAGVNDNKKWIFAMGKGLVGASGNGQPGYLIRGWFSIPKKMRRMGFNDTIQILVENNTANDLNYCRLFIYKWYQ